MSYKYKLKEQPNLAKQIGAKIGDVTYSPDGKTKYIVTDVDPESGKVGWDIINLPALDELYDDARALASTSKKVAVKVKSDDEFNGFSERANQLKNDITTHLRKNYPDEYQKMKVTEEEIDEMSTSAGAGSYLTKYAFKLPKKQKKLPEGTCGYDTDVKSGKKLTTPGGLEENVGATLGPGPKAGPDGVKDNYYVKKFKYKLIPKNKNGNYVQKSSGLEVKNF